MENVITVAASAAPSLEMGSTLSSITSSFSSSIQQVATQGVAMISGILPSAIVLLGASIVVTLGFKYAKKFTSKG